MKEIPLTQGKVALVDDEDFEKVNSRKWIYDKRKNDVITVVTLSNFLYPQKLSKGGGVLFLDGNRLNYTQKNITQGTESEVHQGKNCKRKKKCTSVFVGVCWHKKNKKWYAAITHNYKHIHIGSFSKETEAAAAYNKKAIELYGPNAKLNPLPLEES